jgi:aryl-alcohol dehydrogenase-like predicted oxidoreductase
MMQLAIGTAQFGLNYGINNHTGQVQPTEIQHILNAAKKAGVSTLDTAIAYGESEKALGNNDLSGFNLITKLPAIPNGCSDIHQWINEQITASLTRLNIEKLDAVLLHRPEQLLQSNGAELYQALLQMKQTEKCKRIGVSIYAPEELTSLITRFNLDIVQLPINVFDQRVVHSGWLKRLQDKNIAVHVRSLFLQGLLLIPERERPIAFNAWQPQWQAWQQWLTEQNISPLEGCLRPFLAMPGIEKLVIGIDSLKQLTEIIQVFSQPALVLPQELSCTDVRLLNPSFWSK